MEVLSVVQDSHGCDKIFMEKFDRNNVKFRLWKLKIRAILGKSKRPSTMSMEELDKTNIKELTLIQLNPSNEVLREVAKKEKKMGIRLKLESFVHDEVGDNSIVIEEQAL